MTPVSGNTRRSSNAAGLRMAHRLRRRFNIKPILYKPFLFAGQCPHLANMRRRRLGQNLFIDIIIKKNNTYRLNLHNRTKYFRLTEVVGGGVEGLRVEGVVGRGVVGRGGYEGNQTYHLYHYLSPGTNNGHHNN